MVAYSFRKRFVEPIRVGLGKPWVRRGRSIFPVPKRQTIRADRARHARPGEEIQLYCGMRTKGCFLIGRARCVSVESIVINLSFGVIIIGGRTLISSLDHFAIGDGFKSWKEMRGFWQEEYPGTNHFRGVIIKWEPLS